jgi:hypothetical protein
MRGHIEKPVVFDRSGRKGADLAELECADRMEVRRVFGVDLGQR